MKKNGLVVVGILVLMMLFSFTPSLFGMSHEAKDAENVVIDPLCGMTFKAEDAAAKSEYKGKTYYFCMAGEKKKFDQDPEKYITKVDNEDSIHEVHEGHEHHEKVEHESQDDMKQEGQWMAPAEEAEKANPVEATGEILAKARETYTQKCVLCHGVTGKGDGILAESLKPKPKDLTGELSRSHSDGDLFYKISKGKGAMPAWNATLSEEDRWGMVHFIRSLSDGEQKEDQSK